MITFDEYETTEREYGVIIKEVNETVERLVKKIDEIDADGDGKLSFADAYKVVGAADLASTYHNLIFFASTYHNLIFSASTYHNLIFSASTYHNLIFPASTYHNLIFSASTYHNLTFSASTYYNLIFSASNHQCIVQFVVMSSC